MDDSPDHGAPARIRKPGRPRKTPPTDPRVSTTSYLRPRIRDLLFAAGQRAGRNLTEEIEFRLELTCGDPERLLLLDEFRRTHEQAWRYLNQHGGEDPLELAIEIGGLPILKPGVLEELAGTLGLSRFHAAQFWAATIAAILPYLHSPPPELVDIPAP
jgi:hypothetical protein